MTGEWLMAALHLSCPYGTRLVERPGILEVPAYWGMSGSADGFGDLTREATFGGGGTAYCARPNGLRHGPTVGWTSVPQFAGAWWNGLQDGVWVQFAPGPWTPVDGPPKAASRWKMSRGTGVERWSEGWRGRRARVSYRDGQLDGPFMLFHGPGPPVHTGAYRAGRRVGEWRGYQQVWWYNFYNPLQERRLELSVTYEVEPVVGSEESAPR